MGVNKMHRREMRSESPAKERFESKNIHVRSVDAI